MFYGFIVLCFLQSWTLFFHAGGRTEVVVGHGFTCRFHCSPGTPDGAALFPKGPTTVSGARAEKPNMSSMVLGVRFHDASI